LWVQTFVCPFGMGAYTGLFGLLPKLGVGQRRLVVKFGEPTEKKYNYTEGFSLETFGAKGGTIKGVPGTSSTGEGLENKQF